MAYDTGHQTGRLLLHIEQLEAQLTHLRELLAQVAASQHHTLPHGTHTAAYIPTAVFDTITRTTTG